ncbi:hypothetical protein OWR29_37755 [Actinoplanes sp. Pm04-4]|uniref:Secreted protein n=1 Tax=Paractinoplanes pyxinae TaxID=2997416 RepID=A0ABT4BB78_9ACTN|nr:hypothetical protein [Actinoplanes pyxinae]MCY1143779.1 hypothetical protein [Actinoplanes pyxinae]
MSDVALIELGGLMRLCKALLHVVGRHEVAGSVVGVRQGAGSASRQMHAAARPYCCYAFIDRRIVQIRSITTAEPVGHVIPYRKSNPPGHHHATG